MTGVSVAGQLTQSLYDAKGQVTLTIDPTGLRTTLLYDLRGLVTQSVDQAQYTYDAAGQLITTTNGSGAALVTSTNYYDVAGQMTGTKDGAGDLTQYEYDGDSRVTLTVSPASGGGTTQLYDPAGNVTEVIDPDGNATTYLYDALNRVTSESTTLGSTPTLATTTFAYNSAGLLSSQTDALGRREYFYYDALNRMTSQTWYDVNGNLTQTFTSTFDADGNLITATNNAGTYTMTYDALSRVSTVQEPNAASLTFAYDSLGNRNEMQEFVSGSQVGTIMTLHDGGDRLTSANLTTSGGGEAQVTLSYNSTNGMVATESRSNGSGTAEGSTSYLYDAANRVTGIYHFYASGTGLASFLYTYDAASRISSVTENGTLTATYTYNGSDELTKDGAITYAYDSAGNRTQAGTTTYSTPSAGNEVTNDGTWTYTYDKAGNITGKVDAAGDTWSFTYDNANHMLTAKEENSSSTVLVQATYTYDYFGNLLSETYYNSTSVGGSGVTTTVEHAWDMWNRANSLPQVWADQGSGNAVSTQYLRGDQANQVFADISGSTVSWLLTDYLGSTRYVTNPAGTMIYDTFAYDAWGNIKYGSTTPTPGMYLYDGMLQDPADTELYDANNRWYSTTIGTWTTRDPLGFKAGDANESRFVFNSPTNFTDPSGEFLSFLVTGAFAAYDTYQYATGSISSQEYAVKMGINALSLAADVATGGFGGGTAVRAGALSCPRRCSFVSDWR